MPMNFLRRVADASFPLAIHEEATFSARRSWSLPDLSRRTSPAPTTPRAAAG